jgi:hypothetical protein
MEREQEERGGVGEEEEARRRPLQERRGEDRGQASTSRRLGVDVEVKA